MITRLSSVETLGATTVIMTDKTGTLTENRMTAVRYLLDGDEVETEGQCEGRHDPEIDNPLNWAIRIGALCNNAELGDGEADGRASDPMELALLSIAEACGIGHAGLVEDYPETREYAFDPDIKMMATVHRDGAGFLVAVKGAPESVIERADYVLGPDGPQPLDAEARTLWKTRSLDTAREGLRLLGLAMKRSGDAPADPYEGLTLVGLVCLLDPVREDVPPTIRASRRAGCPGDHDDRRSCGHGRHNRQAGGAR